jgi:hypothetical protein
MKKRILLSIILVLVVLLAACQPDNPNENAQPSGPAEPSPAAGNQAPTAYPMAQPMQAQPQAAQGSGSGLYPGPKSGDEVTWLQAAAMILNQEVSQIVVGSDLKVSLSLKDGRTLIAAVETPEDVTRVLTECGDPCKTIKVEQK